MKSIISQKLLLLSALIAGPAAAIAGADNPRTMPVDEQTPVFITIGQSNADGSAEFDPSEDARLRQWFESDSNARSMKIWYRSSFIVNQPGGERWVFDGKVTDHEPGWLDLWYRNENTLGRTDMNMIHGYGTWSTGDGFDCAQGRRGMEGEFGVNYQRAFPGKDLYFVKLGCSGSQMRTWAADNDSHNWEYFYENMWKPAMESLLAQGKKPRLAGIWWMQGCGDQHTDSATYAAMLNKLIAKCRTDLGFPDAHIYVGRVVAPGESSSNPKASVQFGRGVRAAQNSLTTPGSANLTPGVEIVDSRMSPFQGDQLHFNHKGINLIGRDLAERVVRRGPAGWAEFTTPGHWENRGTPQAIFIPAFGNPAITYSTTPDGRRAATLDYGQWSEIITDLPESK